LRASGGQEERPDSPRSLLRKARDSWLLEFHPDTAADLVAAINDPHDTHPRMVIGSAPVIIAPRTSE